MRLLLTWCCVPDTGASCLQRNLDALISEEGRVDKASPSASSPAAGAPRCRPRRRAPATSGSICGTAPWARVGLERSRLKVRSKCHLAPHPRLVLSGCSTRVLEAVQLLNSVIVCTTLHIEVGHISRRHVHASSVSIELKHVQMTRMLLDA